MATCSSLTSTIAISRRESSSHQSWVKQAGVNSKLANLMGLLSTLKTAECSYVAGNHNHYVLILQPDLTFFSKSGSQGSGSGRFNQPYSITIDSSQSGNKIYIDDKDNHRIQIFTAEGKFLRQFGTKGRDSGELLMPVSIAIDKTGLVYVTEHGS